MNCNINSSGLYDINAYNLTATNATFSSSLNENGGSVYTTNSRYVGIGLTDPKSFLEISDTQVKINFGSRTDAGYLGINHLIGNTFF